MGCRSIASIKQDPHTAVDFASIRNLVYGPGALATKGYTHESRTGV